MADKAAERVTPMTVAMLAYLTMTTDAGRPITPAAHHWLWLKLWCTPEIRHCLIVAPPESAKTTWLAAYMATVIGFWPERPRIYGGSASAVATRRTLALRTMIESDAYQEIFPEVKKARGMAYEAHQWSVAPDGLPHPGRIHPTLSAYGTDGPVTGSRAAEAVGDDILDEKNTRTAYMRDHVHRWLHSSFLSRVIARTGRALIIGTSWHHDDPYERMKKDGSWVVCHIPMLSETDEVHATITYPAGWTGPTLGEPVGEM